MWSTYRFSLFAEGADLTSQCVTEALEHAGYVPSGNERSGTVQTLMFIRDAASLQEAATAVVAEAERIEDLHIARHARSGAVAVTDATVIAAEISRSSECAVHSDESPPESMTQDSTRPARRMRRSHHIGYRDTPTPGQPQPADSKA